MEASVISCPKCGKENQDHYKFCLGCGAELTTPAKPGGDIAVMKTMMADSSALGPRPGPTPSPYGAPMPAPGMGPGPGPSMPGMPPGFPGMGMPGMPMMPGMGAPAGDAGGPKMRVLSRSEKNARKGQRKKERQARKKNR
jgi:signal recognition particle subunit SRP54